MERGHRMGWSGAEHVDEGGEESARGGHTEAHRQHLHHREQTVAAAGPGTARSLSVTVFMAVNCIEFTTPKSASCMSSTHSGCSREISAKLAMAEPTSTVLTTSTAPVADARDQRRHDPLRQHGRERRRQHHHAGMKGRVAEAHLQQQRDQVRHAAAAQPREQIAEQTDAEVSESGTARARTADGAAARRAASTPRGWPARRPAAPAPSRAAGCSSERPSSASEIATMPSASRPIAGEIEAAAHAARAVGHVDRRGEAPTSPIGMLIRKIQCQEAISTSQPPSVGPISGPDQAGDRDEAHRRQQLSRAERRAAPPAVRRAAASRRPRPAGRERRQLRQGVRGRAAGASRP